MSKLRRNRSLYLDCELTCWEGSPPAGMYPEIIQLGIVEVDTENLSITRKAAYYVRPELSTVSEYCTNLTGITQRHVDRQGRPFYEVYASMTKKFGTGTKVCFTWGDDESAIKEASAVDGLLPRFNFINLSVIFALEMGIENALSLEDAINVTGGVFVGRAHDALVDAENTAELHMAMMLRTRA
jgi:inhibitor of KinA sporulation pathway (predicted exonuclease)